MNLNQRASGLLLHPTSLPGPHGIGDFGPDAYRFVDWLQGAGQRLWQWLPTTPIGPGNSPYQSVSAFAGSPLMVALEPLAERAAFEAWCTGQASWLDDYALFMALETAHAGQPWWQWPQPLRRRQPRALAQARTQHAGEIGFWCFVQWCFDTQAAALKAYANARGVHLMGDLPIFIAHHSADCWARPDLYFLDADEQPSVVAGVPPDIFSEVGQRWGNPLYHWERMAAEDFAWWTARIRRAMDQADVFRIDHFRGFAGYYEIPASCPTAVEGTWRPGPGAALFQAIEKALGPLPIVAEDLGIITPDVVALLDVLGFPRMKVLQFAFGGDGAHEFLPHNYAPNTVAYTGTHDNDTVQGWWADGSTPREREFACCYTACGARDIHWGMIRAAANSVSNLAIFPLQDVLGLDGTHRMNLPGSLGEHNWSWRFGWHMVGPEPARVLGLITAAAGRGPIELLRLPG